MNLMQKNGMNSSNQGPHPGGSSMKKGDKLDDLEKPKRIYQSNIL